MKYYLEALYKSFISPLWLASQSKATGKAGKFFVVIMLLLSIGASVHLVYQQIPMMVPVLERTISEGIPDFTAHITDGQLVVSDLPQPYTRFFTDEAGKEFVVVVDTVSTTTLPLTSFFTTSTYGGILITRTSIVSKNLDGQQDLEEKFDRIPNISFSKIQVIQNLKDIGSRFRPAIFAVSIALVFAFWGLGLLIFILLFSLIAFALYSGISKQDKTLRYTWKEILTMSLFAFGLPKLVATFVTFGFYIAVPYLVTAAMVVAMIRALSVSKILSEQQNGLDTLKK